MKSPPEPPRIRFETVRAAPVVSLGFFAIGCCGSPDCETLAATGENIEIESTATTEKPVPSIPLSNPTERALTAKDFATLSRNHPQPPHGLWRFAMKRKRIVLPLRSPESSVTITGNDRMSFAPEVFVVPAGEEVTLTLHNIGSMPKETMGHNWVLLSTGTDILEFSTAGVRYPKENYAPAITTNPS